VRTITPDSMIEIYHIRGLTQAQIAKEWDMPRQMVGSMMRILGVPTRRELARRRKEADSK
jgi:hypothetical protein